MSRKEKSMKEEGKWSSSGHLVHKQIPKTGVTYWNERLEHTKSCNGKVNSGYSVRIMYQSRRIRFALGSSNRREAAAKAATIFRFLVNNGWEETLLKYKPSAAISRKNGATVGDLIATAQKYSTTREQTFKAYTQAFRKIVADIFDVDGKHKHSTHENGGNKQWKSAVDDIALKELTPTKVQAWRVERVNLAGRDASSKRKATVTANSQISNAKALFSKKLLPFLTEELDLPSPLPFEDVQAEKVGSTRYRSRINTQKLMAEAEQELRYEHPEAYKIFKLALVCGLRVSEIDHLLWGAVDLDRCTLHVQTTEHHELKSEDSEGVLHLSDTFCDYLSEVLKHATDSFVVSVNEKEVAPASAKYRCQKHLDFLIAWLRRKGVREQKPIHTLRKEVGSIIASEEGIFAASRYLRHADIQVTASFYADSKNKIIPSIGK